VGKKRNRAGEYYTVFPTAWGPVGAVATSNGLCRIELPHYQLDQLVDLITWEHPGVVRDEQPFEQFISLVRDYFNAKEVDFGEAVCELPSERTFSGKVLRACRAIGYGQTCSYGDLGARIGSRDSARAVATVMSKNPLPLVLPCHRVVYTDGRPGGFSAPGGVELKQRMLDLERRVAQ